MSSSSSWTVVSEGYVTCHGEAWVSKTIGDCLGWDCPPNSLEVTHLSGPKLSLEFTREDKVLCFHSALNYGNCNIDLQTMYVSVSIDCHEVLSEFFSAYVCYNIHVRVCAPVYFTIDSYK